MPSNSFAVLGDGALGLVEGRLLMEVGTLEGIAVHSGPVTPAINTTWAEVSLESAGTTLNNRSVILAAGYVGGRQVLGWTDKITLEPGTFVALRIWSTLGHDTIIGIKTASM